MTIMVILGAGASADSVHGLNLNPAARKWAPPLTDGLFGTERTPALLSQFRAARGLAEEIRHRLRTPGRATSLEVELRKVLAEAETEPTRLRELVAFRFYLQFLLAGSSKEWVDLNGGLTNQAWLVRSVEYWRAANDERVIYVTFNYDSIIDQALEGQLGWDARTAGYHLDGYLADPRFALLKLHGSFDWMRRTTLEEEPGETMTPPSNRAAKGRRALIDRAGQYALTDDYRLVTRNVDGDPDLNLMMLRVTEASPNGRERTVGRVYGIPAIAMPLVDKMEYECPEAHIDHLRSALKSVSRVLSIGWRGGEARFLSILGDLPTSTPFSVVTLSEAGATRTISNLRGGKVLADYRAFPGGFTVFREQERLREVLP